MKMKKRKIALFISSLQKGGSERVMVNLAQYFYEKKYEVVLVTQYKREVEYEINPEIRRIYSEPPEEMLQGNRVQNFRTRFLYLRHIWKTEKPDVILSFLGKNNLMAIATSRFLPCQVAVSVRGEPTMEYEGKLMQQLAKWMFRMADGVILQTKQARSFFPKTVQKKSVIMSNPLNPAFLNRRFTGERENVIVAAGRLDENKNHAMLIHAFSKIAEEFPYMQLVIFGEGESRKALEQLIAEKGLTERISLPGNVSDIAEKISKASIFTLTSNTEGMPNSIMEAMALGLAVVSTDCPCGGPAELIKNEENGMLVPVGDAYALADAMRKILNDCELADKLRENAYNSARAFAPDIVNAAWEKYLTSI